MPAAVQRADSTRSDRSDASARSAESRGSAGKKVSFSRAVRVKKFPRRHDSGSTDAPDAAATTQVPSSPEKKFWFKVYKNRHQEKPKIPEEASYETVSDSAVTYKTGRATLSSASRASKKRPDSPVVKRNHVKKIVQKFDREAMMRHDTSSGEYSPPPVRSAPSHSTEDYMRPGTPLELQRSPSTKRSNRLVNGVKVMFAPLTRKKHDGVTRKVEAENVVHGREDFDEVNNNDDLKDDFPVMVDKATQVKPFELEEFFATDMSHLYSQVDKTKKTSFKPPEIYVSSPEVGTRYSPCSSPKSASYEYRDKSAASSPALSRVTSDPEYGSIRKVKTSSRSFGFNLGRWEHKDKEDSDVSSNISDPLGHESRPGSVLREFDSKKRELSYENVSTRGISDEFKSRSTSPVTSTSGVWVRDIDKDYRRGMADADVTVPSSGYVFTYSATLGGGGRKKKTPSRDVSPVIPEGVTTTSTTSRSRARSPSTGPRSVSSDQTPVRGGLAAAYQARQKAATTAPNGRIVKSSSPASRSNGGPGSSTGSAVSEPAYRRNTVVLYIPGVSHHSTPSEEPSSRVSRSQSVLHKEKPRSKSGVQKQSKTSTIQPHQRAASESDIRRTKSIPKGAKFPWLRIKPTVTATPVH